MLCFCYFEISSLFVIAAVFPKHAISSFSSIFRVALSTCETTRVCSMMSTREFQHPQVMGQIMLLSRVASHELCTASAPLVGSPTLLEGGFSLMSNMCSSQLVWERRIGALVLSAWPPSSFFPCTSLPLDTGGGVGTPTPIGVGGLLVGSIVCHLPPRGGMTEAKEVGGGLIASDLCSCHFILSISSQANFLNVVRSTGSGVGLVKPCKP